MNMKVIKISKVSFDILFFFGIIGIVLMTVLTVASPFIVDAIQEIAPTAQTGTVMGVEFSIDAAELDDASAKQVAYAAGSGIVASLAVATYIAHQIRRALKAVLVGTAFREENYQRLRRVAGAAFVLVPIGWIMDSWIGTAVAGEWSLNIDLPLVTVAGGLLALAIAEIYKAGITLQDESELTV